MVAVRGDTQLTGDLLGGQAAGQQPQHLALALGQAGRAGHRATRLVTCDQHRVGGFRREAR
jgi:hypothetical protein